MLAHYPQLVIVVRNKAEHFGSSPNSRVNEVLLVKGSIPFLRQLFITFECLLSVQAIELQMFKI